MELLGWISSILSIFGIVLNAKKIIWCWYVWLISNVTWLIYYMDKRDLPAIVLWITFGAFNVYGLISWNKDKKNDKKNKNVVE